MILNFSKTRDSKKLREIATHLRIAIIRCLTAAGSGHPGSSLSIIDIVTTLYYAKINFKPEEPSWSGRDRLVLSKGHGVPALYAVWNMIGQISDEELLTLRKLGSRLQGHPTNTRCDFLDASTGSLGQGLSIAQGMALAGRTNTPPFHVYCILGDGECQEGQVWEAAMSAPKFKLDNLTVILDANRGQIDGYVPQVMNIEPIVDKFKSFNWNVLEIDGHNFEQILNALDQATQTKGIPTFIAARTVKGKGVSFMADKIEWHGVAPTKEEGDKAIQELEMALKS